MNDTGESMRCCTCVRQLRAPLVTVLFLGTFSMLCCSLLLFYEYDIPCVIPQQFHLIFLLSILLADTNGFDADL